MENIIPKENSKVIKGVSSLFIVLGHCCSFLPKIWQILNLGPYMVGLFFFYSGYGMNYCLHRNSNYLKSFLSKKIINLWIPFAVAEFFFMLFVSQPENFWDFIFGIIGIQLFNKTLWYVIELLALCLIFFIISVLREHILLNPILFWSILYLIFLSISVIFDIGNWWYLSTSCFLIGLYMSSERKIKLINFFLNSKMMSYLFSTLFIFGLVCIKLCECFDVYPHLFYKNYYLTALYIVTIPMFLFFINIIVSFSNINKKNCLKILLSYIGVISYEIYLYHMVVLNILHKIQFNTVTYLILEFLFTIGLSVLLYKFRMIIIKRININGKRD